MTGEAMDYPMLLLHQISIICKTFQILTLIPTDNYTLTLPKDTKKKGDPNRNHQWLKDIEKTGCGVCMCVKF